MQYKKTSDLIVPLTLIVNIYNTHAIYLIHVKNYLNLKQDLSKFLIEKKRKKKLLEKRERCFYPGKKYMNA